MCIRDSTAAAIKRAKSKDRRIIAIGTSVVRALESAANADGSVRTGDGVASGRIVRETPLRVVDAILTGVHQPGESHFELLQAFANDAALEQMSDAFARLGYRPHEFGDSVLIERCSRPHAGVDHSESFTANLSQLVPWSGEGAPSAVPPVPPL